MRGRRFLAIGLAVLPMASWAHGDSAALGSFRDGFAHLLIAPAHMAALSALGLLAGRHGLRTEARELEALVPGLILGALACLILGDPNVDLALWAAALLLALATVAKLFLPVWARYATAGGLGLLVALGSGDAALHGSGRWASIAGSGMAALLVVSNLAIGVEFLLMRWRSPIPRIGLRVLASWLASAVLLMLALELRRQSQGA